MSKHPPRYNFCPPEAIAARKMKFRKRRQTKPNAESWSPYVFKTNQDLRKHLNLPVNLPQSSDEDDEDDENDEDNEDDEVNEVDGFGLNAHRFRVIEARKDQQDICRMLNNLDKKNMKGTQKQKK